MLRGFQEALAGGATEIATLDADFSHDPAELPRMFEALERADIAVGSRYSGGVRVLNWHPSRLLLSLFANRYVSAILGLNISDATSGFRAYRRATLESIPFGQIRSTGYSFLVEVIYSLTRKGHTVVEVPIIYTERREGQSKMDKGVIFEAVLRPWLLRLRR
jgi:dolichol-phosphate mannosyltransferase